MKTNKMQNRLALTLSSLRTTEKRHCNICQQLFYPEFRFQRFCRKCRAKDECFMFNEWLPRVPEGVYLTRLSA